ncbi:MAG TPA: DUF2092 domain-containing protein [Armatimonadaceae bacterium]|nr:DUF2092 domain-containing protein [Armatimonadaceae bacterium]
MPVVTYNRSSRRGYSALAALALGTLLAAAPAPRAAAQEAAPPPQQTPPPAAAAGAAAKITPEVKELLGKMVAAHQGLKSYTARAEFAFAQGDTKQSQSFDIAYEKPNKVRLTVADPETKSTRTIVSDGTATYNSSTLDKATYQKLAAAPDGKNIAGAFAVTQAGLGLLPMIITDPSAADKVVPPTAQDIALGADSTIGEVPVKVLSFTLNVGEKPKFTLMIGKADNLLRRVSISAKTQGSDVTLTETFNDVKADPKLDAAFFAFKPEPGAKEQTPGAPPAGVTPPAATPPAGAAPAKPTK